MMVGTTLLVVLIMLGAGILGGTVNFYLAKPDDVPPPNVARSVVVGTAASLLVPLFLNMISSELVNNIIKGGDGTKPFVLLGFCLVAAISSTAFIRTLSDRVLDQAKQATKAAQEARADVKQVDKKVDLIEGLGNLPGSQKGLTSTSPVGAEEDDEWNSDPNKGQFGGAAEANARVLEATITPAAGPNSAGCNVLLRVRSTDPTKPLTGDVTFHLHPTFGKWARYTVPARGDKAEDTITSWGSFTVGAVADAGTRLELDLASVSGGTPKFYA
jgi:hypothetical protein